MLNDEIDSLRKVLVINLSIKSIYEDNRNAKKIFIMPLSKELINY